MKASYSLRYMNVDDIPQVVEIDKLSFPTPWLARSYVYEIQENVSSHMVTLEGQEISREESNGIFRIFRRLGRQSSPAEIFGYGGMWIIDNEAHISTIAVHPMKRNQGLGEMLLYAMLHRAIALRSAYCVLEVRVHNPVAQHLYRKFGFTEVGRRKGYYRDNGEDALLMHVGPFDDGYRARLDELGNALRQEMLQQGIEWSDHLARTDFRKRS